MNDVATVLAAEVPASSLVDSCPSCGCTRLDVFHEQREIPIHSCRLVGTSAEALEFPRGSLRLALCRDCGFIANVAYDAGLQDYSVSYEETQGFSPRFREFAEGLARHWVEKYDLRRKTIVEIGCGKVEFLAAMCEAGDSVGIGIDPSIVEERVPEALRPRLTLLDELYARHHIDLDADAIVCRHTLEHIGPVAEFMRLVHAAAARTGAVVLFELPDVLRVLREPAFWDVYYEHCSYFSPGSLVRLFRSVGFDVLDVSLVYDDQYILIEAKPASGLPAGEELGESLDELKRAVRGFQDAVRASVSTWQASVAAAERPVIWGGGSKAVSFLTTLGVSARIGAVVDINPYKQGRFIAGTGHEVVAPEALVDYRPDLVIAMNAVYVEEIRAELDRLGLDATLVAV